MTSVPQTLTLVHQLGTPVQHQVTPVQHKVNIVQQPLSSAQHPSGYSFLQQNYVPSNYFPPGLSVPVGQLYYPQLASSYHYWNPDPSQGLVSVSPQRINPQMAVNGHLDSRCYQQDGLITRSPEDWQVLQEGEALSNQKVGISNIY